MYIDVRIKKTERKVLIRLKLTSLLLNGIFPTLIPARRTTRETHRNDPEKALRGGRGEGREGLLTSV